MPRKVAVGQATDTPSEPFRMSSVLVMGLGSRNLRIGLASNYLPKTMPHVIARRRKVAACQSAARRPTAKIGGELEESQKEALSAAQLALQAMRMGLRRTNVSQDQIRRFNEKVVPQQTMEPSPSEWTNVGAQPPFLIGQAALDIHHEEPYELFWPVQRGHLPPSSEALLCQLEVLWGEAINQSTKLDLHTFKDYQAVVVVPDSFSHDNLRTVMTVILSRLQFAAVVVHQESACTVYGAGVPTACVVDVGDQKTTVCCVEDGMANPASRVTLNYGGSDITHVLYQLMKQVGFPYVDCDLSNSFDFTLLTSLKESHCYVEMELYGIKNYNFDVECPEKRVVAYQMQLLDEVCLAPMSVFYPDLFPSVNAVRPSSKQYDPEDLLDDPYLTEPTTGVKPSRVDINSSTPSPMVIVEDGGGSASASAKVTPEKSRNSSLKKLGCHSPIDKAIQSSIETFSTDEVRRRMYGCILLVGGGLMFPGAAQVLQSRIQSRTSTQFQPSLNTVEVLAKPKDLDPMLVSWKGGAILSCLDSARDLWISQTEWTACGIRILREKSPFIW